MKYFILSDNRKAAQHLPETLSVFFVFLRSQVAQHLASTYGGKAFDVAKMAQVTGQRWPIVGKRLVSEFPYIESEVK